MGEIIHESGHCTAELSGGGSGLPAVLYISGHDPESTERIYRSALALSGRSFALCDIRVADWDKYLTPWAADCRMKGRSFSGCGREILTDITDMIIPAVRNRTCGDGGEIYIAGYSLAGLFSLWAAYESGEFDGAACCSGSVWYPGWMDYAETRRLSRKSRIYLSLGNKEEMARHPLMKTVGDNMRRMYDLLSADENSADVQLVWHEGGHFTDVDNRIAEGLSSMTSSI